MNAAAPQCPLCGGEGGGRTFPFGTVWNGRAFDYVRCRDCRASFLDPMPGAEDFRRMYSQASYHDEFYGGVEESTPTALTAVARQLKTPATLLDFGCGNGAFMIAAAAAGFRCEGVEIDAATRARAEANSGCPVQTLEEVRARGAKFDVVHLGDVLEHLPDPAATMEDLRTLLADGGVFFVEGPLEENASPVYYASRLFGLFKKISGRPLRGSFVPYHLVRASAAAQRRFFERRLRWTVDLFLLSETGWPYYNPGPLATLVKSPGRGVRTAIGAVAIGAARLARPLRLPIGNRFAALVAPSP